MPRNTDVKSRIKIVNILQYGVAAAGMIRDISDNSNVASLKPIAGVALMIMETAQSVKANKEECARMTTRVYELLCAIINICHDRDLQLAPSMLRNIAELSDTLQRILSFMQSQVDGSLIRCLVRHTEHSALVAECNTGLTHAIDVFGVQSGIITGATIVDLQKAAKQRHEELITALSASDEMTSTSQLSDQPCGSNLRRSSSSLTLLPASPKIFHGREAELDHVISNLLRGDSARIAILGPGGVGKSSLALAAVHDQGVISRFKTHRYFISCDSASSDTDLVSIIATNFGVGQEGRPLKAVIRYLSVVSDPVMIILDNLESAWEPRSSRSRVEEFLSLLTDIKLLSVVITMRGAERPGRVVWTRPFLQPLGTLDTAAAQQTFLDLSDMVDDPEIDELLRLTDNLPLAVTLIANLASYEGCSSVLARWKTDSTALLSEGFDRQSNLDASINMSISSPRMQSTPGAKTLLTLLSMLPDGVSDATLEQIPLPVQGILKCRATLCRTSLAYVDYGGRVKVLAPIRDHVRRSYPPDTALVDPLRDYFYSVVKLFERFDQSPLSGLVARISADLGNINSLIQHSLDQASSELKDTFRCIIQLSNFTSMTGLGSHEKIWSIEDPVKKLQDDRLYGQYLLAMSRIVSNDIATEDYTMKAISCFEKARDTSSQALAYLSLGSYYSRTGDLQNALQFRNMVQPLAEQSKDISSICFAASGIAALYWLQGHHRRAMAKARDAVNLAKAEGNLFVQAKAIRQLAFICISMGDFVQGAVLCIEGLKALDALGLDFKTCVIYREIVSLQVDTHIGKSEYVAARKALEAIAGSSVLNGALWQYQGYALLTLAYVDINMGKSHDPLVHKYLDSARSLFIAILDARGLALCDVILADLLVGQEKYEEANSLYTQRLASVRGSDAEITILCFEGLGLAAFKTNNMQVAFRNYFLYFAVTQKMQNPAAVHQALRCIGDMFVVQGDEDTAFCLYQVALDGFSLMDVHRGKGDCMIRMGDIMRKRGNVAEARDLWSAARPLFELSAQSQEVIRCEERFDHFPSTSYNHGV